jgi:hypothetical protein
MNLIEIANKTAGYKRINDDADHAIWVFFLEQLQALADAVTKEKDAEMERSNDVRYSWDAGKSKIAELEKEIERLDSGWKLANQLRLEDTLTIEQLNAKVGMLRNALNGSLDDSKEVLNDYLYKYGENFKPHRIEAQKKIIAEAVQAIYATEADVTLFLNGVKADALEGAAKKYDTSHATLLPSTHEIADSLRGMAKQLRGEQV